MLSPMEDAESRAQSHDVFTRPPYLDMVVGPGESDNARFGELLRRLRRNSGLSRADAATKLGFSTEYLRLIEAGRRTPALGQMARFLETYGAEGAVEATQPDGSRVDFAVFDPPGDDPLFIEFNSRIREARRSGHEEQGAVPGWDDEDDDEWFGEGLSDGRAAEIGLIVTLLTRAEHDTLRKIRKLLEDQVQAR